MIHVRTLDEAHLSDVLRIQALCYREIEPESRESLRAKVVASPGTCFLAETDAGVVAYLITVPVRFPHLPALDAPTFELAADADTLYIHDLAVAETGRGTGAGQALVRASIETARARGIRSACLVAIQGSAGYWQQFGFAAVVPPTGKAVAKLASYGPSAQLMRAAL